MKDMNFFNEFLKEKVKAVRDFIRTVIITLIVSILMLGGYAYLMIEYNNINSQALDLEGMLNDITLLSKKLEVADEERKLEALKKYLSALKELDRRISLLHNLTADENIQILNSFPVGTYLESLEMNEWNLKLVGYALNVDLIPAIVENLSESGLFTSVYAPQTKWVEINEEDPLWVLTNQGIVVSEIRGLYAFEIQCVFRTEDGDK